MFLRKKTYIPNHSNSYYLEDLHPSTHQVRFSSISKDEHELIERRVPFSDEDDACYAFQIISERMMRDDTTLFGSVFLLSPNGVESVTVVVNNKAYTIDEQGSISNFKVEEVNDDYSDTLTAFRKEAA